MLHRFKLPLCRSAVALALVALTLGANSQSLKSPLSPEDTLRSFQIDPGLEISLVAAEPLTASPVALCFDERGRLYVAENRDYPVGPGPGKQPTGTIAVLEDTDGDGRMDRRTEFATGLSFPNGVMPWDGGLIVTCAPDVLYFKDTDGDGRADIRKVLFTGFNTEGSTQLRVSHPTLGPDGWVYLTSGWSRSNKVSCPDHPERGTREFRTDCRFDPHTLELVPEESRAQFGLTFDDFGHRFICYNRVHIQHVVFPGSYLKRNPNLPFSKTVQDVPENRVRDWLVNDEGFAARVYPLSESVTTYESHAGTFTAACSVHVYSGDGLPREYYGNVFACEPTGNLVHREELVARGATFGSHMVNEGREFLASRDSWFRPVFLGEGPDGALYLCDMYRKTIEHPEYLAPETRKHTDFESGKGMGRIWKVARKGAKRGNRPENLLSGATSETLVTTLAHSNGWHRATAHRMLLERPEPSTSGELKELLRSKASPPAARFLAMHLLEQAGGLDDALLLELLNDPSAGVREGAIRLSETRLRDNPRIEKALAAKAADPDNRVRFQCALSLGQASKTDIAALTRIAKQDSADEWARAAILSSARGEAQSLAAAVLEKATEADPDLFVQLGRLIALENPLPTSLSAIQTYSAAQEKISNATRTSFLDGLISAAGFDHVKPQIGAETWKRIYAWAEPVALSDTESLSARKAAIDLLATDIEETGPKLLGLLAPRQAVELQQSVVRSLARHPESASASALLEANRWRDLSAMTRSTVIVAFMTEPRATELLLKAVRSGNISAAAFTARQREQLRNHAKSEIRESARDLFAASGGDRMKAYEECKSVLALEAHPKNGQAVFVTHCASCHRLERQGVVVGPELVAMRTQPKEVILLHVVVPNYEVAPAFTAYELETVDGRTLTGLLASETPTSVTLRQAQGIEETVPRTEVRKLSASSVSLMPDELEKTMSRQELADLLSFLKGEQ